MKLSARVLIPVLGAILLSGGILGYAWWQLSMTQGQLQEQVKNAVDTPNINTGSGAAATEPVDAGDIVLVHLRQGDLLALQGDWSAAEKEFQAAVDAGGGVPALRKLAQAQLQRREIPKVQNTIQELQRQGARSEDLLLLRVIVALRTGELVQAQQIIEGAPDSPQKHYGLALLSIVQGKHEAAKTELLAVINGWDPTLRAYARTLQSAYDEFAVFPESPPIHLTTLLSRALAQVQECELALPLLSTVLQEQDDYRDAWMVQGYCELTTERSPEALASFERAYAIDPEKPEIQYFLGRTYMTLQQWKNASTFLQYALVNGFEPKKEARRQLAIAAEESGERGLALEQLQALLTELDADLPLFKNAVTLAIALDRADDAYQYAQAALNKWPDSVEVKALVNDAEEARNTPSSAGN